LRAARATNLRAEPILAEPRSPGATSDDDRTTEWETRMSEDQTAEPVYVIETIPVAGDHAITREEIQREGIPTPPNLRIFPELGRGGMGRIHPATDRSLLRHVALKRLDK